MDVEDIKAKLDGPGYSHESGKCYPRCVVCKLRESLRTAAKALENARKGIGSLKDHQMRDLIYDALASIRKTLGLTKDVPAERSKCSCATSLPDGQTVCGRCGLCWCSICIQTRHQNFCGTGDSDGK